MIGLISKLVIKHPSLRRMQHFVVDADVCEFARQQQEEAWDDFLSESSASAKHPCRQRAELILHRYSGVSISGWRLPASARLPASEMTLTMEYVVDSGRRVSWPVCLRQRSGRVWVSELYAGGPGVDVCVFEPMGRVESLFQDDDGRGFNLGTEVAYVLSLINEPRLVLRAMAGSRQQRRAAQRGFGFAVDAWTRVSWNLSKATKAKLSRDESFHCMPLHFRRGHWRAAKPHYSGAVQRPDAFRFEDRSLWWQWIEPQWVGHPAFGFRKSVHAPKLSSGKLAQRLIGWAA